MVCFLCCVICLMLICFNKRCAHWRMIYSFYKPWWILLSACLCWSLLSVVCQLHICSCGRSHADSITTTTLADTLWRSIYYVAINLCWVALLYWHTHTHERFFVLEGFAEFLNNCNIIWECLCNLIQEDLPCAVIILIFCYLFCIPAVHELACGESLW